MNSGKLSKRIKILRSTNESDDGGGILDDFDAEEGWETIANTWASIDPASASTREIAQQRTSQVSHEVIIRYRKDISEQDVIKYNDRRLDIDTIINLDEGNRYLKLECMERQDE